MVLEEFVEHYNDERPHRGIDLEVPVAYSTIRNFTSADGAQRADRLGGLVHEDRVAAQFCIRSANPGRGTVWRVTGSAVRHSPPVPDRLAVL